MLFSRSQMGIHGTWQRVWCIHSSATDMHCIALCFLLICCFLLLPPHVLPSHNWESMEHDSGWVSCIHSSASNIALHCVVVIKLPFSSSSTSCCSFLHNWECMEHGSLWVQCTHLSASDITLLCVIVIKLPFSPSFAHGVPPFTTGNTWNMTVGEFNAPIYLQMTLHCIVWLLLCCHSLLPSLMVYPPLQLGIHGTWQQVSMMHPLICKQHCVALCGCY